MNIKKNKNAGLMVTYCVLLLGVLVILFPLYIVIITSFKSSEESARSFFAFPESFYIENFNTVINKATFPVNLSNSLMITVTSVLFIVVLSSMCAYAIARNMSKNKYYKTIFYYLLAGIFVPFQVIMVPLVRYMSDWHLDNQLGVIVLHISLGASQAVFLLVNYIKAVPKDLEEASVIDGCSYSGTFWRIVMPLIKPMTGTVLVLNVLWVWNDFMMPLLILNKSQSLWTLPLFQFNFRSQYTYDYNLAFASYLMTMIPVLVVYICAQKHIVAGLSQGALKG